MKEVRVVVKSDGTMGRVLTNKDLEYLYPVNYGRYTYDELERLDEIDYREATFEEKVKYIEKSFSWGKVLNIHLIGDYQIIEYIERGEERRLFHGYFRFNDMHTSYETLDKALTGVIFERYEGPSSQLNSYVWRMLENNL